MTLELIKELFDDMYYNRIFSIVLYYIDVDNDINDWFPISYNIKKKKFLVSCQYDDLLYDSFEDFVSHFKFTNGKMIPEVLEYLSYIDD